VLCLLGGFGLVEDVVSILGTEGLGLGGKCERSGIVGRCGGKVDVEGTCVFNMGWGREKFC
jgi:hypothetical protein